ncbi:MAG TPA: SusC/RagA family TonB-linked outer membrane protein, partial [Anaerovoracaceae bacterium]|nr:SusC/RagA family TonB-linked outer membrane protein [Anaerovoracaceae bacterium]
MKKKCTREFFPPGSVSVILLRMKLLIFFVLVSMVTATASSYSQQTKFSLNLNRVTVKQVFQEIEANSEFVLLYKERQMDSNRKVDVKVENETVESILNQVFENTNDTYKIYDRQIVILASTAKESPSVIVSEVNTEQKNQISGTVKDNKGLSIPGVSVVVKGTTTGTITDANGKFMISVPTNAKVLVFSFVGMKTQEFDITGKTTFNVVMEDEAIGIEEVVLVGYGTQKKVNLTGGLSSVSSKQLQARPITNVASALQGTMPGVTVIQNTGQPGLDQGTIRVRGIGTLNNSDAMVVVDGLVSSMRDVNPNDIENITVLKDAASAAIYGSRAANGVILITTKKGKSGKVVVNYNSYYGIQQATKLPDYLSSSQAASFYNEAVVNEGQPARYTAADIQKFKDGSDPDHYPNTDWLGLFYTGSGFQQNHFFDVSGGNDKTQSLLSLGYFSQDGIVKSTGLDRFTSHFKISTKIGMHFTINGNLTYTLDNFKEPTNPYTKDFSGYFIQINTIGANIPYKLSNGLYGFYQDGNPIAWLENGGQNTIKTHYLKGIIDGDMEISKGFHFKPLFGYLLNFSQQKRFVKDIQYYDPVTKEPAFYQGPNALTDRDQFNNVVTFQSILQYDKTWGNHDFSALVGYSQEYTQFSYLQGYKKYFLNNSLSELDAG